MHLPEEMRLQASAYLLDTFSTSDPEIKSLRELSEGDLQEDTEIGGMYDLNSSFIVFIFMAILLACLYSVLFMIEILHFKAPQLNWLKQF